MEGTSQDSSTETYFLQREMEEKSFDPIIIPEMQEENKLASKYQAIIASAQIEFDGETYTYYRDFPFLGLTEFVEGTGANAKLKAGAKARADAAKANVEAMILGTKPTA